MGQGCLHPVHATVERLEDSALFLECGDTTWVLVTQALHLWHTPRIPARCPVMGLAEGCSAQRSETYTQLDPKVELESHNCSKSLLAILPSCHQRVLLPLPPAGLFSAGTRVRMAAPRT